MNNKQQINKTKIIVNDTSCGGDLVAQFLRPPSPSRLDVARRSRKRSWRFLGGPGARDDKIRLRRLAGGTAANRLREPRRRIARARESLLDLRSVPRAGSAWREARKDALGLAAMPTRRSCIVVAGCGTGKVRVRRADGSPAPAASLPGLRTFPRDWRPTCAALGEGAGGEAMSPGRRPWCGEERCYCCDQYAGYRGRELRPQNFDVLLTPLPGRRSISW